MDKAKAIAASWGRSFLAAVLTLYMAGVSDPKPCLWQGLQQLHQSFCAT